MTENKATEPRDTEICSHCGRLRPVAEMKELKIAGGIYLICKRCQTWKKKEAQND